MHRNKKIGFVGAPFERGQPKPGVSEGPAVIRKTELASALISLGYSVEDRGDVREETVQPYTNGPQGERDYPRVMEYCHKLSKAVEEMCSEGHVGVCLGGDHSVAIGSVQGHANSLGDDQELTLVWVDAHADINTGSTSASGNMHGMSVNFLLQDPAFKCIKKENVVFIGLRDVDPGEQIFLDEMGILYFEMEDVDSKGIDCVIRETLEHLRPSPLRPLHLSFDIDSLDPIHAPATGTKVCGGLSLREGCRIASAVGGTGVLGGMDLVEVNPTLADSSGVKTTAESARAVLLAALAGYRGGRRPS